MAAPKGNEYWRVRITAGRKHKYKTAEEFESKINEYFEHIETHNFEEELAFHNKGDIVKGSVAKMRPFTIEGLCNFLDIDKDTFKSYEKRDDVFLSIITRARQIIYNQKFEGAAAGFFNSSIIARDLGLADKQETTHTGNVIINETREE